jgi:hypothetical protein
MRLKSIVRTSLALVALAGLAGSVARPEPAAAAQAAPPAAAASPSPSPTPRPGKDPLLEFVPREHVPADSAVSFPVDI